MDTFQTEIRGPKAAQTAAAVINAIVALNGPVRVDATLGTETVSYVVTEAAASDGENAWFTMTVDGTPFYFWGCSLVVRL